MEIFARWKAYRPTSGLREDTHVYRLHAAPPTPLDVGMQVRLFATSPVLYRIPGVIPKMHDTYDPHVVGLVTDIKSEEGGWVTVGIRNRCRRNVVQRVEVEVPQQPGVTIARRLCSVSAEMHGASMTEGLESVDWFYRPPVLPRCRAEGCVDNRARHKFDIPDTLVFRM